jgi:DNA invertase Pin-like site-specific DNA recombinase
MTRQAAAPPAAYSYLRFSSPQQAAGDTLRRQRKLRDDWLARSGAVLDTSLCMTDAGVSAFRGRHRTDDKTALGAFLGLVRRGRIPRGSFLIVESLDRLSREGVLEALSLVTGLLRAGIRIVQLLPVEMVYDEAADPMRIMMCLMELARGNSESRVKSERVAESWAGRRAAAATMTMGGHCPAWLRVEGGRFVVDEDKAAAVKEVFRLAAAGHGLRAICQRLNDEAAGFPAIGLGAVLERPADGRPCVRGKPVWLPGYVGKLLGMRAVLGELQPMTGRRAGEERAAGPALANYYPVLLTEREFDAAQAALASRKGRGGRPPKRRPANLWAGLLYAAGTAAGKLHVVDKGQGCGAGRTRERGRPVLVAAGAFHGVPGCPYATFPLHAFESAVLDRLREIKPADILPGDADATGRVVACETDLAAVEARLAAVRKRMEGDEELESLVVTARALEQRKKRAVKALADAKREAASPLADSWAEYGTLAEAAGSDPEARCRLRACLRRMVAGIWCLFHAAGKFRLAAVQVRFAGGGTRDYLIVHRGGYAGPAARREPRTWTRSFAESGVKGRLDLRRPEHVARLAKFLASAELPAG